MNAIETLEERISELEKRIHGAVTPSIDDPLPETSVIDNILHVNTLISSALSGRERTSALVKRLPQLNELLDTSYDDNDLNTDAKLEVLLTVEDDVKKNFELFNKLQELMPCLEIDKIKNIPELSPKLEHLSAEYLKLYEDNGKHNEHIYQYFSKYNEIIDTITKTLISLDNAVTAAEIAAAPPKRLDRDI
ncbi:uncharacterized protein [Chelonus insularis]|uniref:uncharacterized protein n=1 Tax=Chelonus insularis TaxID=460826 RepID=UPI001588D542|nr:uncharacterized protein LOC118065802 [Chelonus insularis]